MKKLLLSALALSCGLGAFAQSSSKATPPTLTEAQKHHHVEMEVKYFTGHEKIDDRRKRGTSSFEANGPTEWKNSSGSLTETVIGTTTYDLQTNTAIERRIVDHGNGTYTGVWTFSLDQVTGHPNRGTGYNYFDGNNWGSAPTSHIETDRVGWPGTGANGFGEELILAHNTDDDVITMNKRASVGSGTWTESDLTQLDLQVWSRMALGGNDGNTVHLVGLTLPTTITGGNPGVPYQGIDGALLYNRSLDGGATWDIKNYFLPGVNSSNWESFGGDSYSIDARGETVAIVTATLGYGVDLWKSTDNGSSWTRTRVVRPAIERFDETDPNHFIANTLGDAMYTADGTCHVLLDNNDNAHVWWGAMFMTNETTNDGLLGFFPNINRIDYWNEINFTECSDPVTVAFAPDLNGNGVWDGLSNGGYRFTGLAAYPHASIDNAGNIYLIYKANNELLNDGNLTYSHTFGTMTSDNGCTWTVPFDINGDAVNDFNECVYGTVARHADTKVRFTYQRDFRPGIHVNGVEHVVDDNDIVWAEVDAADFATGPGTCATRLDIPTTCGDTNFCPGDTVMLMASCGSAYSWSTGETTQSITINSVGTYSVDITTSCGVQTETVTMAQPNMGPVFTVALSQKEACPGDMVTASAVPPPSGASYLWSTGATSPTTTITAPGTYSVTVSTCGGSTIETFDIVQPTHPPQAVILGDPTLCAGNTETLASLDQNGGNTYQWSVDGNNLGTGPTQTINTAGTYQLDVTDCAGTSSTTLVVVEEALPDATIAATATEVCEGEPITLTVAGSVGSTYEWSNGSLQPSITLTQPSESGSYSVTITNKCGATDNDNVSITINPTPNAPVVTANGNVFTATGDAGLTYEWFVNGTSTGVMGDNWTATLNDISPGDLITAIGTDANGCFAESATVFSIDDDVNGINIPDFDVYPNPNDGEFVIEFKNAQADVYNVTLRNLVGQLIHGETVSVSGDFVKSLDFTQIEGGIYFLTVTNESQERTAKIVIK